MPKISDEELTKVLARLWKKDYEAIKCMATPEVPPAQIIRDAIHSFVLAVEARARRKIDAQERVAATEQNFKEICAEIRK